MTHRARVNIRKVISLLTAVSILLCNTGFVIYSETETEQEPVTVLYEDESLRGEYEKHFAMSDGTYLAVAYPDQIHYEENGEWKDIDNTLVYNSSADRYVNTSSGDFSASFASTAGTAKTVKLEEDEYELSWRVRLPNTAEKLIATTDNLAAAGLTRQQAAQISTARVEVQAKAAALAEMDENERAISTENAASQIVYPNLLGNGIDVRYTLSPYAIEEDVILHNRVYSFTGYEAVYSRNGLTAVHNEEENTVLFYDKNGNIRFTVNPPSMYDSADAVSTDIELTVTNTASEIIIKVEPNTTWLGSADRVYPVVIDPTSHTFSSNTNTEDTYVKITETSGTNLHYSEDRFRFGMYDGVQTYGFIQHKALPNIPANAYISSAYCTIYQVPSQTVVRFNVGIMTAPWSESTINASNIPSYTTLQTNLSYSGDSTSNRYKQIYITDQVREAYAKYNATGVSGFYGLGFETAEPTVADWNAVCSSSYATASKRPTLTISYTLYEDAGLSNGIYRIKNTSIERFADASSNLGTYVDLMGAAAIDGQFWRITPMSNNTYIIRPYANIDYALTFTSDFSAQQGQIQLKPYSASNLYQRWSIVTVNGEHGIRPAFYNSQIMRPSEANTLETYTATSTTNGGWSVTPMTDFFNNTEWGSILARGAHITGLRKVYTFTAAESGQYHIETLHPNATVDYQDTSVLLFDSDDKLIAENDDKSASDEYSKVTVSLTAGETYKAIIRTTSLYSSVNCYFAVWKDGELSGTITSLKELTKNFNKIGDADSTYNCLAYALGETHHLNWGLMPDGSDWGNSSPTLLEVTAYLTNQYNYTKVDAYTENCIIAYGISEYRVQHFALVSNGIVTAKCGSAELMQHEGYDVYYSTCGTASQEAMYGIPLAFYVLNEQ